MNKLFDYGPSDDSVVQSRLLPISPQFIPSRQIVDSVGRDCNLPLCVTKQGFVGEPRFPVGKNQIGNCKSGLLL